MVPQEVLNIYLIEQGTYQHGGYFFVVDLVTKRCIVSFEVIIMIEELWENVLVEPFVGDYKVSNLGRIKSMHTHKIMKQQVNVRSGYKQVSLVHSPITGEKVRRTFNVHRLVALAFVHNDYPDKYTVINHKDEDKTNNVSSNLEWCDTLYNMNYGTKTMRQSYTAKYVSPQSKTIPINVKYPDGAVVTYNSLRQAADATGLNRGGIIDRLRYPESFGTVFKGYSFTYANPDKKVAEIEGDSYLNHGKFAANHKMDEDEFSEYLEKNKPSLSLVSMKGATVTLHCSTCGSTFDTLIKSVKIQKYGCPTCALNSRSAMRTYSQEEAQEKLTEVFGNNIIIVGDYKKMDTPCKLKCSNCGREFAGTISAIVNNGKQKDYQGNGCEHCSKSRYRTISNLRRYHHTEEEIEQRLKEKHLWW